MPSSLKPAEIDAMLVLGGLFWLMVSYEILGIYDKRIRQPRKALQKSRRILYMCGGLYSQQDSEAEDEAGRFEIADGIEEPVDGLVERD